MQNESGKQRGMAISRRKFIAGFGAASGMIAIGEGSKPADAARRSGPPLVFIHGIKGSVLTDARGSISWLTVSQALGLTSPSLSLPLQWHAEAQQRDGLIATAPLTRVAWHDVYAPFLNWASASGYAFHPFAYDWRRDNQETTDAFISFLDKVKGENGGARMHVVSHSMGVSSLSQRSIAGRICFKVCCSRGCRSARP